MGFVNEDFVVGYADAADQGKTSLGEDIAPMKKLDIIDIAGETIKEYQQDNIFTTGVTIEKNMITLKRVSQTDSGYTGIADDYIVNNEEQEEEKITPEYFVTEFKELQWRLTLADGIAQKDAERLTPKLLIEEKPFTISFQDEDSGDSIPCFYVYGNSRLQGIFKDGGRAITAAETYSGLVINEELKYVWERGNRYLVYTITEQEALIQEMRTQLASDSPPLEALGKIEGYRAVNYSGVKVEQMLYSINCDRPVVGVLGDNSKIILIGFDETNVEYIEVNSGETKTLPATSIDQMVIAYLGII